jgi:hypothetical protein
VKISASILAVLAAIGIGALYLGGTFDRPLSSIGLNHNECARNGLGVTFCGEELTEYRTKVRAVNNGLEESKRTIAREQGKRESTVADEQAATETKERRELERKMAEEKGIFEREPENTVASDEAKDEYEGDRAALQQLNVR